MKVVFKYHVPAEDTFFLALPAGAEILSVHAQHRGIGGLAKTIPFLWALVDPTAHVETRYFRLVATGETIDGEVGKYIGTFHLPGPLVFHLFELEVAC